MDTRSQSTQSQAGTNAADEPTVAVDHLDGQGRGVAQLDGRMVFVEGGLPGEEIVIRPGPRRRRALLASVERVVHHSPERVDPKCAHFDICGGCRLQHLHPSAQLELKQRALLAELEAQARLVPEAELAPLTGPLWGYRRRARLGVKYVPKKGGTLVGFREKWSPKIAETSACEVLVPSVGRRIGALREMIDRLEARTRIPQIEVAVGEHATALVFRVLDPLAESDRAVLIEFARTHELQVHVQPGGLDSVTCLWPLTPPPLSYRLAAFDLEYLFRPTDFIQVNAVMNEILVAQAVGLLNPSPSDRVLDLYCGIGNFSLALARGAGHVTGVESNDVAVQSARANAERNVITNAVFEVGDLSASEPVAEMLGRGWDKLLLDPPRSGAAAVVGALARPYPQRIVYVSCNPATFASDASALVHDHGYRLIHASVVDMFPHTAHAEVLGLFVHAAGEVEAW